MMNNNIIEAGRWVCVKSRVCIESSMYVCVCIYVCVGVYVCEITGYNVSMICCGH